MLRLSQIENRLESTVLSPWVWVPQKVVHDEFVDVEYHLSPTMPPEQRKETVEQGYNPSDFGLGIMAVRASDWPGDGFARAEMDLIANAKKDLRWLIDALMLAERLRFAVEKCSVDLNTAPEPVKRAFDEYVAFVAEEVSDVSA